MATNTVSAKDIKRNWHLIDARDQILGRVAVQIAGKLQGKGKTNYVPYLDMGDYVVVTNASEVKVSGKKTTQKKYARHSGFPGGYREETFDKLLKRRPEDIIRHAVKGMLPKNKLSDRMIIKLHVFPGDNHTFQKQLAQANKTVETKEEVKGEVE